MNHNRAQQIIEAFGWVIATLTLLLLSMGLFTAIVLLGRVVFG